MKRVVLFLLLLLVGTFAYSQATPITDTGTLRTRINADIKANNTSAITGDKLNRILNGHLNVTQNLVANKVDSAALADSLQAFVRLQTQNPTASLSVNNTSYERLPSGANLSVTLSWGAGRQAATASANATANLYTINVYGNNQSFSQPAAGATVTGTRSASIARNTYVPYTILVTTNDGKTATANASTNSYDKRYIGWATTISPTDAEIRAAVTQDNNGGTASYSASLAQLSGARYLFYANTVTISSVTLNGFPATSAFSLNNSRTFTNASGGSTTYYVTVINAPTGDVSSTSVTFQ